MNPLITDFQTPQRRTPVIVALDLTNKKDTLGFIHDLDPTLCQIKIGKELFIATRRSLAESLIHQSFGLSLDLGYHDIPHTAMQIYKVVADTDMWMVDTHAPSGHHMMETVAETVIGHSTEPLLIGVTVLASMEQSDLAEVDLSAIPEEQVIRLAKLVQSSGLDNVVCSAQEAIPLRHELGQNFVLITPSIRLDVAGSSGDQRRIMTSAEALTAGSTYLVASRLVIQAVDPVAVLCGVNRVVNLEAS